MRDFQCIEVCYILRLIVVIVVMNLPDELLMELFRRAEPEKLLMLYRVSRRFRNIVQDMFMRNSWLLSCKLENDKLIHAAWRYLAPRTRTAVESIGFRSQFVIYRTTQVGKYHSPTIDIIYPKNSIIYFDRQRFMISKCRNKLLYDEKKDIVIDADMPGSRSGNTCIHQIRFQFKKELHPYVRNAYPCYLFVDDLGTVKSCSYCPSATLVHRVNIPPVRYSKCWIDAICDEFIKCGIRGPHLFIREKVAVAFRVLTDKIALQRKVLVFDIPSTFPISVHQR